MTQNQKEKNKATKIAENVSGIFFVVATLVILWGFPDFPFHATGIMKWVKGFCVIIPVLLVSTGLYVLIEQAINRHYNDKNK